MDAVVEDAIKAVARAEAARADAQAQLYEAWAQRTRAFSAAGWTVVYTHVTHGVPPSQALVVEDAEGQPVDLKQLDAEAIT